MSGRRPMKRNRAMSSSVGGAKGRQFGSSVRKLPKRFSSRSTASNRRRNTTTAGFVGIEHKFFDTFRVNSVIGASDDATGGVQDPSATVVISAPGQGTGPSQRDGKKILIESILISGVVILPDLNSQAAAFNIPSIYIAIVMDTQSNAASMTSELAFVNASGNILSAANPLKNLLRSTRFQTIKVWSITPQQPSFASDELNNLEIMGQTIPFEFFKKVSIPVNFNGAGTDASIANVSDNSLHVIAFSNVANYATITYSARIRFVG